MKTLLEQLKQRRIVLDLKQSDMMLRIGISRQQYQRLESKGNPRLDTLELIAKGLKSELMLIPQEKLSAVKAILENDSSQSIQPQGKVPKSQDGNAHADDPWKDLLEDDR